jgi:redox-sensitive bicupin YhaK (pirin superfamily)
MGITIYTPKDQARGAFDGGKITEQKPIGFSGEGSVVKRIGPLFYWAWARAEQEGYIPLHPHQAFEIITYVIKGQAEHGDSLGTKSVVGAGGAQVMQTGSGVSHEERFIGPDMEGFQIWFEPFIQESIKTPPQYHQYDASAFPLFQHDGVQVKTIIGQDSPVELIADAQMWDVQLFSNAVLEHTIPNGYAVASLALQGNGSWIGDIEAPFQARDFVVLDAESEQHYHVKANSDEDVRLLLIQVPLKTDYKLYPKW